MPKMLTANTGDKRFLEGYTDDPREASVNHLCPPSQNCFVLKTGEVMSRGGLTDSGWDLNEAAKTAQSIYVSKYNVTFFSINGKVKYIEHDRGDAIVDTGLSLSATETTVFAEFAGDVYCTNKTNGLRQIHVFRLNDSAPDSGDATVTIDQDGAGRLTAFGDTSGNLRIRGTNEAYTSLTTAGVVTLTGTLSATYADNDIAITVEDISSGRPKAGGITFWQNGSGGRMILWDVAEDTGTYGGATIDVAPNAAYHSKFATIATIEAVISFDTSSTADIVLIGQGGKLTEVVTTRDYNYYFTEENTFYAPVSDVNVTTGAVSVIPFPQQYGCIARGFAKDIGNGRIVFLTKNKRIISIEISTDSGAPVVFPNEQFDRAYQNTLEKLDESQTGFFFYSSAERLLFCHVDIDSERVILPFDTTINRWQPPIRGWNHSSMFVKSGVTYACDGADDTIYSVNEGQQDNGFDFECVIATSIMEREDGRTLLEWRNVGISGRVTEDADVFIEHIVSEGDPQIKTLSLNGISFSVSNALGSVSLGTRSLASAMAPKMGNYDRNIGIPTTWGVSYQLALSSVSPFSLKSFALNDDTYLTLV